MADTAGHVSQTKWIWTGLGIIVRLKDNRRANRATEWQIAKGVTSVRRTTGETPLWGLDHGRDACGEWTTGETPLWELDHGRDDIVGIGPLERRHCGD